MSGSGRGDGDDPAWRPPTFESWIDRQIREATERGEFDNLPGAGKPVNLGDPNDELWWVRRKLEKEDLSGALPTSLSLRKEKERIQDTLSDVRDAELARAIITDLNARIAEAKDAGRKSVLLLIRLEGDPRFMALSIE